MHYNASMRTWRLPGTLNHLQELYGDQSHAAQFEVSKRLFKAKMHDGQSVHDHGLTIIKDLEKLKKLGMTMHKELQTDLIPQSLLASYEQFIVNYHMNKIVCTKIELLNKLVTNLGTLKKFKGHRFCCQVGFYFQKRVYLEEEEACEEAED